MPRTSHTCTYILAMHFTSQSSPTTAMTSNSPTLIHTVALPLKPSLISSISSTLVGCRIAVFPNPSSAIAGRSCFLFRSHIAFQHWSCQVFPDPHSGIRTLYHRCIFLSYLPQWRIFIPPRFTATHSMMMQLFQWLSMTVMRYLFFFVSLSGWMIRSYHLLFTHRWTSTVYHVDLWNDKKKRTTKTRCCHISLLYLPQIHFLPKAHFACVSTAAPMTFLGLWLDLW